MTQTPLDTPSAPRDVAALAACDAVLFDFDGTLADTAPDLAAAVNQMRHARGLAPAPYEKLRPLASAGARGLIGGAFGVGPDDHEFAAMREEFLANYAANLRVETALFPGIDAVLDDLDARGVLWGIVTNKVARLTDPLVKLMHLDTRAASVVSGDTTPYSKPHPAPLLHAAETLGIAPHRVVYVGDDLRDIQAGHAAGMATIAAAYGYCGNVEPPAQWNADYLADTAETLLALLRPVGRRD
ncbi:MULTISPECIES: phosphoglycolate phosphatase [Paraburkholderia]|uniref:phosphoglycolate phosphatase n=1 Tax=Paraburkholderia tropica TaxID=92647 RepID=A0ABX5MSX5_9BURK|nr:phosphoglycolate phosphatase [Paraburkholderia tropica]MBB2979355.1 phosphoglycolate phosphatase [Paraburkholderia tropica]MDE1143122.1 phosphoglycolate phosphatase [Paraburkholderia tropica]OBR53775.1 phosphoglycolate phosphatase [Paraburkholderia tropica]PXX14990.1 phosphoglycolate phosphatase [Paraburkholderia tropica]PZW80235.1 phosphoglycolate phosphatase [Paraburkholderia tropica]